MHIILPIKAIITTKYALIVIEYMDFQSQRKLLKQFLETILRKKLAKELIAFGTLI